MKWTTNPNKDGIKKKNYRAGILIYLEIDICLHRCTNIQ